MALSDVERRRYARHLLLPEIASSGQERLCASRVRAPVGVASEYLTRAGVQVAEDGRELREIEVESDPLLAEAARALSGALSAVEAVKAILELGAPQKSAPVQLSSEDV